MEQFSKAMGATWGAECRLATLNVNGVRSASRCDSLALFLVDFRIKVCVRTETHLTKADLPGFKHALFKIWISSRSGTV